MVSNFSVAGWVVAGLLGALLYSQWVADEFSFRHLKRGPEGGQAQQQGHRAKHTGAPLKNQPTTSKNQPDCEKSEKRDDCFLQLRATEAAEVQAKSAADQVDYTWLGLWLLFFTLVATAWAARGAARAARAAERALVDLEQPQVFVDVHEPGVKLNDAPPAPKFEKWGAFKYRFRNFGRTPAHLVDIKLSYPIVTKPDLPPSIVGGKPDRIIPAGVVVAADVPYSETENLNSVWGVGGLLGVNPIKERLFFMGWFRYRDIFGATYRVGFCFVFDPISVPCGRSCTFHCRRSAPSGPPVTSLGLHWSSARVLSRVRGASTHT